MQKISLIMQVPVWQCWPTAPNHCSDKSIDQTQAMNPSATEKVIFFLFGNQCNPPLIIAQAKALIRRKPWVAVQIKNS